MGNRFTGQYIKVGPEIPITSCTGSGPSSPLGIAGEGFVPSPLNSLRGEGPRGAAATKRMATFTPVVRAVAILRYFPKQHG